MEETELERHRRRERERKRIQRARRSPSKVAAIRAVDAQRRRLTLLHESEHERELRKRRERVSKRIKRLFATPEEIEERRKREREATAERRKHWTPEEKEEKRRRDRERNAYKRFIQQQNPAGPSSLESLVDSVNDIQKIATATVLSESLLIDDDSFLQSKLQKKELDETHFQDNQFKKRRRTAATSAKSEENQESQSKKMVVVPNHQHFVMSNLSSLWKNKKLCDAGIGNGTSTVMIHKVVLSAVCPKLLSVFSTDISSPKFLQVNFPEEVSKEALNAFAEYMYNGILEVDRDILKQLKIIAKRLDMKEFEQLCDKYLPNDLPQPTDTLMSSPIPTMTSSSASSVSASGQSAPALADQAIKVKQEISAPDEDNAGAMFDQESNGTSLDKKNAGNADGIYPRTKTGPDKNKDDHLSSSSNQVFTSTTSPFSSSLATASTSISSVPASSTDFSIPISQSTGVKSTRLKPTRSYETPLVSDLSPVIGETFCSQSSDMNENSSKQLNRQSISTSIQLPSTTTVESVAGKLYSDS